MHILTISMISVNFAYNKNMHIYFYSELLFDKEESFRVVSHVEERSA